MKWGCVVVVLDWATNSFLVYLIYSRFYSRLSFIQFKRGHVNLVEWSCRHDEMALAQRVGKNFSVHPAIFKKLARISLIVVREQNRANANDEPATKKRLKL